MKTWCVFDDAFHRGHYLISIRIINIRDEEQKVRHVSGVGHWRKAWYSSSSPVAERWPRQIKEDCPDLQGHGQFRSVPLRCALISPAQHHKLIKISLSVGSEGGRNPLLTPSLCIQDVAQFQIKVLKGHGQVKVTLFFNIRKSTQIKTQIKFV